MGTTYSNPEARERHAGQGTASRVPADEKKQEEVPLSTIPSVQRSPPAMGTFPPPQPVGSAGSTSCKIKVPGQEQVNLQDVESMR